MWDVKNHVTVVNHFREKIFVNILKSKNICHYHCTILHYFALFYVFKFQ